MSEKIEHYNAAMRHYGQRQYDEAVAAYDRALALDPEWTEGLQGKAMALMNAGKLDEALQIILRVTELAPSDPLAFTSLSMIYQRKDMIDEAETAQAKARMLSWKQELKTNPDAPPPPDASGMDVIQ